MLVGAINYAKEVDIFVNFDFKMFFVFHEMHLLIQKWNPYQTISHTSATNVGKHKSNIYIKGNL